MRKSMAWMCLLLGVSCFKRRNRRWQKAWQRLKGAVKGREAEFREALESVERLSE